MKTQKHPRRRQNRWSRSPSWSETPPSVSDCPPPCFHVLLLNPLAWVCPRQVRSNTTQQERRMRNLAPPVPPRPTEEVWRQRATRRSALLTSLSSCLHVLLCSRRSEGRLQMRTNPGKPRTR